MTRGREHAASPEGRIGGRSRAGPFPPGGGHRGGGSHSPADGGAVSPHDGAPPAVSFAPPAGGDGGGEGGGGQAARRGRSPAASRRPLLRNRSYIRAYSVHSISSAAEGECGEELSVEEELMQTANELARPGFGILAADETPTVLGKRFAAVGLENTLEMRRAFREMLYSAADIEKYASGVVMFSETVHQETARGVNFVEMLAARGILVGVKLDRGLHPFGNGEMVTEGLDGIDARVSAAYAAGIRFAKWRSLLVINFENGTPSALAVEENANALAKFAAACQQRRLVPLIEPEIYIAGTHGLNEAASMAEEVLSVVYRSLARHGVLLEGTLLKLQMCLPGAQSAEFRTTTPEAIAAATLCTLRRVVPAAVPGVVFLSGGQSEVQATVNLNAINREADSQTHQTGTPAAPWTLSFAFGRVLQASALALWAEDTDDKSGAAKAMVGALLRANSRASLGRYKEPHPSKQMAAIV